MKKNIAIPRNEYKRKFSVLEIYRAVEFVPIALTEMFANNRKNLLDKDFVKKLQLAVTEVNGCAACSYAHTYMALKQGMSNEEINSFLSGDGKFINQEESKAILFAQHYADTGGFPKKDAFESITSEYGEEKAKIILSTTQLMMVGNIYGIPLSAFQSRLDGKPYKESSLFYELGMLIIGIFIFPIALIHGILRATIGFSNIRFGENSTIE